MVNFGGFGAQYPQNGGEGGHLRTTASINMLTGFILVKYAFILFIVCKFIGYISLSVQLFSPFFSY